MIYDIFASPIGDIVVSSDGKSITNFRFVGQRYFDTIPKDWILESNHRLLRRAIKQADEYFKGTRKTFDIPLSPIGTEFQKAVWLALDHVPYGKVTSYKSIAQKIGNPKAVRAVGSAIGKNPICIIVPCHRIVGTNGALTGYAGGLERKERLLGLEGGERF